MRGKVIVQPPCGTCGACCRDAAGAKYVASGEARAIAQLGHTGFLTRDRKLGFRTLVDRHGACCFYDRATSRCGIYEHRPFDCRVFPYDILRGTDGYLWIKWGLPECVLHSLLDDLREVEQLERTALPAFVDELPAYARYTDSLLAEHRDRLYAIIRPVILPPSGLREEASAGEVRAGVVSRETIPRSVGE